MFRDVVSFALGCLAGAGAVAVAVLVAHLWAVAKVRREMDRRDGVLSWPPAGPQTWPEWIGDDDSEPDRDAAVIVLGVPKVSHRMVCRVCVKARADGRFDEICEPCQPLLISPKSRP